MHGDMPGAVGGLLVVLLWLLMTAGMVIGYIVLLVAIWRLMRAHESVAESMKELARKMRSGQP